MKFKPILILFFFFCISIQIVAQENVAAATIEQLEKEMYRLYPTRNVDEFMDVTERLKEASLKAGNEGLFYRAWANQAYFIFSKIDRQKGMEIAKAMNEYSKQHDSKLGIYYSSLTNANQSSALRMEDEALKLYLNAIQYKQKYLPNVNASAAYIGAAKVYHNRKQKDKVLEMTDKALAEPNIIGSNIVDAWSYRCMASMMPEGMDHKEELNSNYEEWKKAKEKYNYNTSYSNIIEIYHAQVNGDYKTMLELAKEIKDPQERNQLMAHAYEKLGETQEALDCFREYKRISDSLNSAEIRRQISEHSLQLDVIRAENQAKELLLHNQSLKLAHAQDELEQRRLEEEALNLTLKNREIELSHATIKLKNDSLDRHAQQLKLSEYKSKLELEQNKEKIERITLWTAIGVGLLVITFLCIYLYRRSRHMKALTTAYDKLETAYEQLEHTTTVKNRIENELRIARDIQMTMVPEVFPDRADLDMHAYIQPAKEVGGDLYTFLLVDRPDDEDGSEALLYFCIGDVSGKGVPASLFMAQTTRLFRSMAAQGLMPAEIANRMNRELSEHNDQGMFVTMFIGLIDLHTGHTDFCNCGHNPPVINGEFLKVESNAPLALWPEMDFVGEEIDDIRGQRLLLYTDGLNEAEDESQNQFGDDHLLELMQQHADDNAQQTIDMLREAVAEHVGNAQPSDDLTMLCISIKK
jgi:serine phosphatase RsbU (regulator of sigma subunit)